MNKYKIIGIVSAVGASISGIANYASAGIIDIPSYTDVVNASSTTFGSSFFTDLLPWLGLFLVIAFVGLALASIMRRLVGGLKRVFGGGRRGGRRRRR